MARSPTQREELRGKEIALGSAVRSPEQKNRIFLSHKNDNTIFVWYDHFEHSIVHDLHPKKGL
jgi:hypothetical protein